MSPTFRALAHRNFRRYYAGGLVSNTGTWMQRVAQDWLVLADRRRRDAWLACRLRELTPDERAVLREAAPILERLSAF